MLCQTVGEALDAMVGAFDLFVCSFDGVFGYVESSGLFSNRGGEFVERVRRRSFDGRGCLVDASVETGQRSLDIRDL